ncbi:MAG: hypothetical protein GSR73_05465, partial [Desulfurococcales archaeon]|nr:hypothetical protein [Desulfurococcales archaeon]
MADSLKTFAIIAVLFILLLTGQIAFSQPRDHWNNIITEREINFKTRAIAYCEDPSGNDRIFLVFRVDSEVDSFSVTSFDRDTGDIYSVGSATAAYIGYTGTGVPMAAACEGNYL